jgi:hypothetical protein
MKDADGKKAQRSVHPFLLGAITCIIGALGFMLTDEVDFFTGFWISFNTCTTLGLGNPTPKSKAAQCIASALAITGPAILAMTIQWTGQFHQDKIRFPMLIALLLLLGTFGFASILGISLFDAFYFSVQISTSLGYGDDADLFDSHQAKFLIMVYAALSISAMTSTATVFLYFVQNRLARLQRGNCNFLVKLWTSNPFKSPSTKSPTPKLI